MTEKYITIAEAVEKYQLNNSKFTQAVRKGSLNGLYKAIFRKRTRIYLHQEHLEKWLSENSTDVNGPSDPKRKGRPKKSMVSKPKRKTGYGNRGNW